MIRRMKLVWLTDLHLVPRGQTLYGHDPVRRLELALEYMGQHHLDADYCLLTGDLVNEGDDECYRLLDDLVSALPFPYLAIPGNHDDRQAMTRCLSLPPGRDRDDRFIQYAVDGGGYRLIGLDTLRDGHADGELCAERLGWIDDRLAEDVTTPTVVFMHHHPGRLQLPIQDGEILRDGEALLDRLSAARNVRHILFGHVHRPVSGSFRNIGFSALQSCALQAPLPYPQWDWECFVPAQEPPALGIVHLDPDSVVVHFHPFCDAADGFVA